MTPGLLPQPGVFEGALLARKALDPHDLPSRNVSSDDRALVDLELVGASAQPLPKASAAPAASSSGVTSRTRWAMFQRCPNGSTS